MASILARRSRVFFALCGSLALGLVSTSPGSARALENNWPDDSALTVATRSHVDSPKVTWVDGKLDLLSEFSRKMWPIEETINYLGRGYDSRGQRYMFTVPQDAPELKFIGEAGVTWYQADYNTLGRPATIWAGIGADANVPAETFRDALFTLDLVDVRGPGRVEAFVWAPSDDSLGLVRRLFSSTDQMVRSYPLTPGNHTHNYTLFSLPGRYELTFRATARTKDGHLLLSEDRVLQWQIGGNIPGQPAESIASVSSASEPTFSVRPVGRQGDVDEGRLHAVRVDLGRNVTGVARFSLNGFRLAEVQLAQGVAEFSDFLGAGPSQLQVQVLDDEGATVWQSAVLPVEPGLANSTTSAGHAMAPVAAPSQIFPAKQVYAENEIPVSVHVAPGPHADSRQVEVNFGRPGFIGIVELNSYLNAESTRVQNGDHFSAHGTTSYQIITADDSWSEGEYFVANFRPHPLLGNVEPLRLPIADLYEPGKEYTVHGTLRLSSAAPQPETPPVASPIETPSETPSPTASATPDQDASVRPTATPSATPTAPQLPPNRWGEKILITSGHLDIAAIETDRSLGLVVRDDTRTAAKESVDRAAEEVAIFVPDDALVRRVPQGSVWEQILGKQTWLLPEGQRDGLPWPGYSTERLDYSGLQGPVRLELVESRGPGEVAIFQTGPFGGEPHVLLGSRAGAPRSLAVGWPTHAHANWAFTAPGVYSLTLRYTATLTDGTALASEPAVLTFVVGNAARVAGPSEPTAPPSEPMVPPTVLPSEPTAPPTAPSPSTPQESDLRPENRGNLELPERAEVGQTIMVRVPGQAEGAVVHLYAFSTPTYLGALALPADGILALTLPAELVGRHRVAAYVNGQVVGWGEIEIVAASPAASPAPEQPSLGPSAPAAPPVPSGPVAPGAPTAPGVPTAPGAPGATKPPVLAKTGTDLIAVPIAWGALVVGAGLVLVSRGLKRRW